MQSAAAVALMPLLIFLCNSNLQCFSTGRTSLKDCPYPSGSGLHQSIYMVPWAHRSHHPNGISIGSAVFAGPKNVTNRQTHRQTDRPRYSVCRNRLHLAIAAMRFNNYNDDIHAHFYSAVITAIVHPFSRFSSSVDECRLSDRCTKSFVGWGFAPDPAVGAYSALRAGL